MTDCGRSEPDAGDAVEPWQRFVERRFGLFFAQMAEEAEDELRRDAVAFARVVERAGDARDDGAEADAARGVTLRVEEDFGVADIVGAGAVAQIGRAPGWERGWQYV